MQFEGRVIQTYEVMLNLVNILYRPERLQNKLNCGNQMDSISQRLRFYKIFRRNHKEKQEQISLEYL
jgi:hypothetical protein